MELFRGLPRDPGRGSVTFVTSLAIHFSGVVLLLIAAPQIVLQNENVLHTILIAPLLPAKVVPPPPAEKAVVPAKAPVPPRPLRPAPRILEPHIAVSKLDAAPVLPNVPRPQTTLPVEEVVIRPAVKTGVFGSNLPAEANPKLPVASARDAGFDPVASQSASAVQPARPVTAGFDVRSNDGRPARAVMAAVSHAGFDVGRDSERPAAVSQAVRATGFDQPKPVSAPVKQAAGPVTAVRPVEILDKPKPIYTAEARSQKIEGAVLLDVVFTASGEVRVLGVVRGLGHGLDENAIDAARHIRFTPAMQSGTPVDQRVTLHVVFQITG